MALSWIIAGGGTGGHVTPALALGEVIKERGEKLLFIGSQHGLEAKLVPDAGFELLALPSQQVMGRSLSGRITGILRILSQVRAARRALLDRHADVVISVGGFAAMPAALAALATRRPLILVEPNAIPGRVNRITARFARMIFLGFAQAADSLSSARPVQHVGIPLRNDMTKAFNASGSRPEATLPLHLLIFGGSQGAHQINETMIAIAPDIAHLEIEIFHQTGKADLVAVREAYAKANIKSTVVEFEYDMPSRYQWADLAISRAGALTVAELALAGLPAFLVPYPFASDNHQVANAEALSRVGAAECLDSKPLNPSELIEKLKTISGEPKRLSAMSQSAMSLSRPLAARQIIDQTIQIVQESAV